MSESPTTGRQEISEVDLHGYIDGELPTDRRAEVEAYLTAHPEHAARMAEFSALTLSLHRLYGGGQIANPDIDALTADLDRALRRRRMARRLFRIVAAVLILTAGTGVVSGLHGQFRQAEDRFRAFTQQATDAHRLFAGNVSASDRAERGDDTAVVTWLSQRLTGIPLRAPDLRSFGYELSVERILPFAGGPAAQLLYEGPNAERSVTLFIGKGKDAKPTAFTYVQNEDLSIFYWQEGPFAYSLAGNLDRAELLTLAEEVNSQLVAMPPVPNSLVERPVDAAEELTGMPPPTNAAPAAANGPAAGGASPKPPLAPIPVRDVEAPEKT